jgi:hypothetical protein
MHKKTLQIPPNRLKLFIYGLLSFCFVAISLWLLLLSILFFPISLLGVLFFGLAGSSMLYKAFAKNSGLFLLEEGIRDASNFVSIGMIRREDIEDIHFIDVQNQSFIQIMLNIPEDYIAKGNKIQQFWMKLNYKTYGTPISISCSFLRIKQDKLQTVLRDHFGL